jgi:hypothetical protein
MVKDSLMMTVPKHGSLDIKDMASYKSAVEFKRDLDLKNIESR